MGSKHLKIGVICPLCQKRLSAVDVLRKHLKTQHPDLPTSGTRVCEVRDVPPPPRPVAPIINAAESGMVRRVSSNSPGVEVNRTATSREEPPMPTRPIRYLDLRPTSPERQELATSLERWRTAILDWPSPLNRTEIMASFDAEKLHGTWLEYMRTFPPPPFPSFVQPFYVGDSVMQHTQLPLRNVPEASTQPLLRKDRESSTQQVSK